MSSFVRSFHTSRRVLEQESTISAAKESIENYLNYFKTPKDLRPFVYRKRNASELLSRDLWDEVAKKRIVPLEPPKVPSSNALERVFANISEKEELHEYKLKLIELAKKPKYTTSSHINAFLRKSSELDRMSHALKFVYSQKTLAPILSTDNLNFILFFLYINPAKTLQNSAIKVSIARKKLYKKSNQVTDLLEGSIYLKHKSPIPAELSLSISKADPLASIPKPLDLTKNQGKSQSLLNEYQYQYLTLKPIELEFKSSEYKDTENVSNIIKFVESYDQLQSKLGKQNLYELVNELNTFGKFEPKETAEEGAEAVEEAEAKDESK